MFNYTAVNWALLREIVSQADGQLLQLMHRLWV